MPPKPTVGLVGAGRLASTLAPLLVEAGYGVTAIASPGARSARRLASSLGRGRAVADSVAVLTAELVLLAVPDRSIDAVARELAAAIGPQTPVRTFLHHAGALGLPPLRPLKRRSRACGVLHPLQSLAPGGRGLPAGTRARVEGDRPALVVARRLCRDLGLVPLRLAAGAAARESYHAAAAMASNDLIGLLSLAVDVLETAGLSRKEATAALLPLVRGTLDRVEDRGLAAALTGPVVRGDAATLAAHLRRLDRTSRPAAAIHRALSERLLRIASARGEPSEARRRALRRVLRDVRSKRG
jgi:predicted short-subunit dehydrogenase-like oxidoreductase (DUF2520 family)